jgi:hypothetical protein
MNNDHLDQIELAKKLLKTVRHTAYSTVNEMARLIIHPSCSFTTKAKDIRLARIENAADTYAEGKRD